MNAQGIVHAVRASLPGEQVEHDYRDMLIAPGFIDSHVHFPQLDVIGSPAEGLLPWVGRLFPNDHSYLSVYDRFGLIRLHSLWGHCIHLDPDDRALLRDRQAVATVCPTSNLFLGSGLFNFAAANHP